MKVKYMKNVSVGYVYVYADISENGELWERWSMTAMQLLNFLAYCFPKDFEKLLEDATEKGYRVTAEAAERFFGYDYIFTREESDC